MANSVGNNVSVRGPRKELQRFMDSVREEPPTDHPDPLFDIELARSWLSLDRVAPRPDDVPDELSFQMIGGRRDWDIWREWLSEHWGTKWICDVDVRWVSAAELHYFFDSAWNPPLPLFDHLARRHPRLIFSLDATDINMEKHWQAEWANGKRTRSVMRRMSRAKCADIRMAEYTPEDDEEFKSLLADYTAGYRHRPRQELHLKRGLVYLQWAKPEQAVREFDRAIQSDKSYAAAYLKRAVAYRELGLFDRADADHRAALRLTPKDAEAHYEYGRTQCVRGDAAEGLRWCKRAVKANAYYTPVRSLLADIYGANGFSAFAETHFKRILELHPTDFGTRRDYADLLARWGKCEEATLQYTEAMRLRPLSGYLLLRRGLCFLLLGQSERAVRDFEQLPRELTWFDSFHAAASLARELVSAFVKGRVADAGRVRDAVYAIEGEKWERTIIVDSWENFAAGLRAVGVRAWKSGDYRGAIRHLQRASLADPTDAECFALLAWAYATRPDATLRNGRRAAALARRAVRLVTAKREQDHTFLSVLAAALAAAGDCAQAAEYQRAAIKALPKGDNRAYLGEWIGNDFRFADMGLFWPYKLTGEETIFNGLRRAYRRRLQLYRANKPFHLERDDAVPAEPTSGATNAKSVTQVRESSNRAKRHA